MRFGSADLQDRIALWYQDFKGISMHYEIIANITDDLIFDI